MLDYKTDRLDYGQQLIPPRGYDLDRAVAATFSLDLDTLISIPVALHFSQTLDGKLTGERFQVLEAIKRAAETVQIYCQAGRIKVPKDQNALYAYVEPMVTEILPGGPFESFHPKVWILRYVSEGQPCLYRVLVLTRNLTFDRSWDLAAMFEGKVSNKKVDESNEGLLGLLKHLNRFEPIKEYSKIHSELAKVNFDPIEPFKESPKFVFSGLTSQEHPLKSLTAQRTLVMSPFLHDDTLKRIRKATKGACWLFSRREELLTIPESTIDSFGRENVFQISRLVVDGEQITSTKFDNVDAEIDEEDGNEIEEQNLHAKLMVLEDESGKAIWHLGSANATEAGMTRNTEFGVELWGKAVDVGIEPLIKNFLSEDEKNEPLGVFEVFEPSKNIEGDEEREEGIQLRHIEHSVLAALEQASGSIKPAIEKDRFDVTVNVNSMPHHDQFSLFIRPFNTKADWKILENNPAGVLFGNIPEHELSVFIEIQIRKDSSVERQFLRKIKFVGMPESRLSKVFRRIVENKTAFLRYIQFLLQDEVSKSDLLEGIERSAPADNTQNLEMWAQDSELYERLLVAASRNPRKLKDIDTLLKQIQEDPDADQLIPDAFIEFWQTFAGFIEESERSI